MSLAIDITTIGAIAAAIVLVLGALGTNIVLVVNAINRRADQAEASRREIAAPQQTANAVAANQPPVVVVTEKPGE